MPHVVLSKAKIVVYKPVVLSILCLLSFLLTLKDLQASTLDKPSDTEFLNTLYHTLATKSEMSVRLNDISRSFLNKPYELGALGEGSDARFDQWPLYRTDSFDCGTYVDTVLALALAANIKEFKHCINQIRYDKGQVDFTTRNHFTALEWNTHNQRQGYLKDITRSIKDAQGKEVAQLAKAWVDKKAWYEHLSASAVRLLAANTKQQAQRLAVLRQQGQQFKPAEEQVWYLPLNVLFDEHGKARQALFAQIPNATIIEIVRPNWDLTQSIGTHMNISHLGFAFWQDKTLKFRHASLDAAKVVDVSLIEYLDKFRQSPTIKGINLQIVLPKNPLAQGC